MIRSKISTWSTEELPTSTSGPKKVPFSTPGAGREFRDWLKLCLTFSPQKYNIYLWRKSEVIRVSPRTGRPTDNPKSGSVNIRLDSESEQILLAYCKQEGIKKAEGVRQGIKMLASRLKK